LNVGPGATRRNRAGYVFLTSNADSSYIDGIVLQMMSGVTSEG
jgi:hypothetical protein